MLLVIDYVISYFSNRIVYYNTTGYVAISVWHGEEILGLRVRNLVTA